MGDALRQFTLPIKGLKTGLHTFNFNIDSTFFTHFENSPITEGQFEVRVEMDKRERFFELTFDFDGTLRTDCDRCSATIDLPFGDTHYLMVKYSTEEYDEDSEVVFISPETTEFNVAQYIYECICLSEPLYKIYDCENDDPRPCDEIVLEKLRQMEADYKASEAAKQEAEEAAKQNPFNDLKNLFDNN